MKKHLPLLLAIQLLCLGVSAQDFMLQSWYWDYPKTCEAYNWADTLKAKVPQLQNNFNYVWLPPLPRASFGNCSNGYDPKDLYDLGEYGGGATGFGTRTDLNELIAAFGSNIKAVADVVYNHRDGGDPEQNTAVEGWIENMNCTKVNNGDQPFPADRYRCVLPLGGSSNNGAGDYYFKFRSASKHPNYYGRVYKVYMITETKGYAGLSTQLETEGTTCSGGCSSTGNGGCDCGQCSDATPLTLGRSLAATIDNVGSCSGSCGVDEFKLTLSSADFNAAGDNLYIFLDTGGVYSDVYISGLWSASRSADIQSEIQYQTYTDFTDMPSNQGEMNHLNFKPNGNPTKLDGDWDWLWFFYDYDQDVASTRTALFDWTRWLWTNVGIRGYRMDAVKHFPHSFVNGLMNNLQSNGISPGVVVGEFFDTNPYSLRTWIDNANAHSNATPVRAFDFGLRAALKSACDQFGYDVRNVFSSGIVDGTGAGGNSYGFKTITFVNNHDYRDAGQPVQNDPMLAYAYILTNNQVGMPCVFYPEYFGKSVPNYPNVNLRTPINDLISIHKNYIFGSNKRDYLSRIGTGYYANYSSGYPNTTLFYQLAGGVAGKDLLVAINFAGEPLTVEHQINADLDANGSNMPVNTPFNELTANSSTPILTVNNQYRVTFTLPARSYAVWVQGLALPVELVDFQAKAAADHIELTWESAMEQRFKGYELERSADGENFVFLASVASRGNENTGAAYQYQDHSAGRGSTWYYRLKMSDLDGSVNYSPVRSARLEAAWENPILMPNPTAGDVALLFKSPSVGKAQILVYDAWGRKFSQQATELSQGRNTVYLAPDTLPSGVYFVALEENGIVRWRERGLKL